jgi:hypothetical protein
LGGNSVEIFQPLGFGEEVAFGIRYEASVPVLILPFNVEGAAPEFILAPNLNSNPPLHT